MSETDSWSSRLKSEVFSSSSVVVLTAAVFALAAAYVVQGWSGDAAVGTGALLSIGIGVPSLYDEWPAQYTSAAKMCLWTAVESIFLFCVYALVFVLAVAVFSVIVACVLAIVVVMSVPFVVPLYRIWMGS